MKYLIFVVGAYFLAKSGVGAFHVMEHFSSYNFSSAYSLGYATGQVSMPVVFLVVGVILIRHSVLGYASAKSTSRAA